MLQKVQDLMCSWEVSKEDREIYLNLVYAKNFPKGQKIFSSETECRGLVLIEYGALRAYIISPNGKEINLFVLKTGDYCILSASCMLKNISFEVNLEFIETSSVFILPSKAFNEISNKYKKAKQFHLDLLSSRLSNVVDSLSSLAFMSLSDRVMAFLLNSIQNKGTNSLYITHEEIANSLGSAREAISRVLKELQKQGKISQTRGIIEILEAQSV
ncbi:Crp/Fnr family transcriptional regulator [Helicobacter valdiviensis]|nr:Crp/Fnr family transcriptional regulator [Helicobacter valdiviensis]